MMVFHARNQTPDSLVYTELPEDRSDDDNNRTSEKYIINKQIQPVINRAY